MHFRSGAAVMDAAEEWLTSVLRQDREPIQWPACGADAFAEAADAHGVVCLVERGLRTSGTLYGMPRESSDALLERARVERGIALARGAELKRVCSSVHDAGVPALVFKGAALAYTHYSSPHLRPRNDTDVLVREEDRGPAGAVLQALGYSRRTALDRDAIFTQEMFRRAGVGHVVHLVDLHWRVSTRPMFRDLVSFEELAENAVTIEAVGPFARTPGAVHALLIACVHPVSHHHCDWLLIWLYDIMLMAQSLTPAEWERFKRLAVEKGVSIICKRALELTARCFGSRSGIAESAILSWSEPERLNEPSAAYLSPEINPRRDLWLDVTASKGLAAKCRLLLSHAFPDVQYMRAAHGATGTVDLAAAYGRRLMSAGGQLWRGAAPPTPDAVPHLEG